MNYCQDEKDVYRFWESCRCVANHYIDQLMVKLKYTMLNPMLLADCVDVTLCTECCNSGLMYVHAYNSYVLNESTSERHYHLTIKNDKLLISYLYRYLSSTHVINETNPYANGSYKDIQIPVISTQSQIKINANVDTVMSLTLFEKGLDV